MTVTLIENYGNIKADTVYPLLETGYDWVRIRCRGKSIYIPSMLVE